MKLSMLCFTSFFVMIEGRKLLGHRGHHGSALIDPNDGRALVTASEQCETTRDAYIACCSDENYACDPCFDSGDGTHAFECSDTCTRCPAKGSGECLSTTEETVFDGDGNIVSYSFCICLAPSGIYGCITEELNANGTGHKCSTSLNGEKEACQCTICRDDPNESPAWFVDCSAVIPDSVLDECNDVYTGFFAAFLEAEVANCTADMTCTHDAASVLGTCLAYASMIVVPLFFII